MRRAALSVAIAALSLALSFRRSDLTADFKIDEAHKLSETYYLRLVIEGRLHHPDWFRSLVERTNPPVGKWLYGLPLRAGGLPLPTSLAVAEMVNHGQRLPPAAFRPLYRAYLRPARIFDALVTAATAVLILLIAANAETELAGIVASILYIMSFLPQTFSTVASFDPLLALAVLTTCAVGFDVSPIRTCLAALATGIAFNVRVTGLIAWPATLAGYITAVGVRKAVPRCITMSVATVIACLAINPYYWTTSADPSVPAEFRIPHWLAPRIVSRLALQWRDLHVLLRRDLSEQTPLHGFEKARFVSEYACGDFVGMLVLLGVVAFVLAVVLRRAERRVMPVAAWSVTIVAGLTAWLPFGYPRYVLTAMPPLVLLAGFGWSGLFRSAYDHYKRRRNQLTTRSLRPV